MYSLKLNFKNRILFPRFLLERFERAAEYNKIAVFFFRSTSTRNDATIYCIYVDLFISFLDWLKGTVSGTSAANWADFSGILHVYTTDAVVRKSGGS